MAETDTTIPANPRPRRALSDTAVKGAKAEGGKVRKLTDGATPGLQLWAMPNGSRLWRLDYRHGGTRKTFAIGSYPSVSLASAREAAREAKTLVKKGVDPVASRRANKEAEASAAVHTFGNLADALIAKKEREQKSDVTMKKVR